MTIFRNSVAAICASLLAFGVGCGTDNVAPTISTQPANQTVLAGAAATFSVVAAGTAPLTYQWNKGGGAIAGAASASYTTPATTLADDGSTFTVTIKNAKGSVTSNPATLTVNAPPAFTAQPSSQTVNAGASVTFSATATGKPAPTYQWNKDGAAISGATSASYTIASAALADAGSYTVTASNSAGSVTSNAAVLTVNAAPAITTQPSSKSAVAGTSVSFTVVATGSPAPTYQWKKDGAAIAGATSATFTIASASLSDAGSYTVVITNSLGSVTSTAATLTVYVAPTITSQPSGQTVSAGASVSFTVAATGTPAPTYQWKKDGVAIAGATSATYPIASATLADAGTYTVVVSNPGGSVTSNGAVLVVNAAPVITAQPQDQSVVAGQTATFSVTATGFPAPTYQWQKSTVDIGGATGASYTTPATVLGDSGTTYRVVITNTQGTVTSNSATLTVTPGPVAPSITSQPVGQTVDAGASVTFTVVATGTPTPTYQWKKDGVAIGGATSASFTIASPQPSDAGSYTVVVSNSQGTVTSDAAVLIVQYAPVINTQPVSQGVTVGNTATFSVAASGVPAPTYQWQKNTVDIGGATSASYTTPATILADNGATFRVVVTNTKGSVTSNAATLTVTQNHAVSGNVFLNFGGPAPGVTITISTPSPLSTTTDGSGNYSIGNVPDGTYTVTPSITGPSSSFSPASRSVTVSGSDVFGVNFQASLGYTVSGTALYSGGKTGRIYLTLAPNQCCNTYGVSLASPGAFTIRGVAPGAYTLKASMDVLGFGASNAADPVGTTTGITVSTANLTGKNVTLTDPAPVDLTGVSGGSAPVVSPTSSGAIVFWNGISAGGIEQADHYNIYFSTSSDFTTGVNHVTVPATGNPVYIQGGLTDTSVLYYRITGKAGSTESNPSASSGPITIGAPAGGHTISGTVTFPGTATGPLYAGVYEPNTGAVHFTKIASPASPQAFSILGVPSGSYFLFGVLDQNDNGYIDPGDITNTGGGSNIPPVTVGSVDLTGQSVPLSGANASSSLTTHHSQFSGSNDNYSMYMQINSGVKLPVALALTSGPHVIAPVDVGGNTFGNPGSFSIFTGLGSTRPGVSDTYAFSVTYSDSTSETINLIVTTVLDSFAQTLAPAGVISGGPTVPTFTWTAPASPPGSYSYFFSIYANGGGTIWQYPNQNNGVQGMPSGTTSLLYNLDSLASQPSLTVSTQYNWSISVQDSAGNQAQQTVSYTPAP